MQPINKTAALCTSKEWKENVDIYDNPLFDTWDAPKPMIDIPWNCQDLVGMVSVRLRVIGYMGKGKWQVRCLCGRFASRKTRSVIGGRAVNDACDECQKLAKIKSNYIFQKTGKRVDKNEFTK